MARKVEKFWKTDTSGPGMRELIIYVRSGFENKTGLPSPSARPIELKSSKKLKVKSCQKRANTVIIFYVYRSRFPSISPPLIKSIIIQ